MRNHVCIAYSWLEIRNKRFCQYNTFEGRQKTPQTERGNVSKNIRTHLASGWIIHVAIHTQPTMAMTRTLKCCYVKLCLDFSSSVEDLEMVRTDTITYIHTYYTYLFVRPTCRWVNRKESDQNNNRPRKTFLHAIHVRMKRFNML